MKKIILMTAAVFALTSCEKESKTVEESTPTTETTAPAIETTQDETHAATENAEGQEVSLEIGGTDDMKFTKKELRVPAGSKVTLKLVHEGKMSKETMGHNWILLKPNTNIEDFAMEALKEKDNNYLPQDDSKYIVATEIVGGGESTTITFDAPEAGTYDFICSFPGHFGSMQGKFIVE